MGRDQMKSASRHDFHEAHTPPTAARIPFETLVRENRIEAVVIALADASKAAQVREVCERLGVECREFALA